MAESFYKRVYMSATGHPFTDGDAVNAKALVMSAEIGVQYSPIQLPCGGFGIIAVDSDPSEEDDQSEQTSLLDEHANLQNQKTIPPTKRKSTLPTPSSKNATPERLKETSLSGAIKFHPSWFGHWLDLFIVVFGLVIIFSPTAIASLFFKGDPTNAENWDFIYNTVIYSGIGIIVFAGGRAWFDILSNTYTVTHSTINAKVGIIKRKYAEVRLCDIRTVDLNQSIVDRLLGIGTLMFSSAGTGGVDVVFRGIYNPTSMKEEIMSRCDNYAQRRD